MRFFINIYIKTLVYSNSLYIYTNTHAAVSKKC